jgi:hypothetical protein
MSVTPCATVIVAADGSGTGAVNAQTGGARSDRAGWWWASAAAIGNGWVGDGAEVPR